MSELEQGWKPVVAIWWLILWRSLLGGFVLGAVVGFIIGFVGVLLGVPGPVLHSISGVVSFLVGTVWSLYVLRMALRKKYRGFRVALVSTAEAAASL